MKPALKRTLIALLLCLPGGLFMFERDDGEIGRTGSDTASLTRSESVIEAKIARKQAKIDSGKKKPQHPDGFERHRNMVRPHPEGANITHLLLDAKRHVDAMPRISGDRDAGLWNWEWLGPGNIGGRVRAVMTHPGDPDILWAGSAGGGIWKTTNGGSSWYPLHDLLPSLAITSLTMDPTNSDVIYAGTGEGFGNGDALPGAGVFKSTNGGGTWSQLGDSILIDAEYVNDIVHHPIHSGWLLAVGYSHQNHGAVWRSTDGGATWNTTLTNGASVTDVKVDPDDPAVVIVGTKTGAFRSTGFGVGWTSLATGGSALPTVLARCEFAFHEGSDVVYASCNVPDGGGADTEHAEIWRSLDNGVTWSLRNSTVNYLGQQGWYNNVIWVEPQFSNSIIVGGINLYKSIDGGSTLTVMSNWQLYHGSGASAHADQHAITPNINYDPQGNRYIYIGNDGGVQAATNGFLTTTTTWWLNLANNLGITQFYGADASPDGSVILGGSQDNDDLRFTRTAGAQDWYQAHTGDGTYCAINPVHPDTMYTAYVRLEIARSTDGGNSYIPIHAPIGDAGDEDNALFIAPFALDKVGPYQLLAGGTSIWRSHDHGWNWNSRLGPRVGSPRCSAIEISPTAGSVVSWVGYEDGQIWKSENTTLDWTGVDIIAGVLPDDVVTDIEISPHDPSTVIVTFGGYFGDRVWRTTNNGVSWTCIEGTGFHTLPAIQKNCVTFHPNNPNWIYVGTDLGLFASEDLGQTWGVTGRYGSNEGPVYTEISDLFWHSGNTLVAATHGRGMYECKPLEIVWVDETNTGAEDGTQANPWNTFWEGNGNVGNGATLIVGPGDYDEGQELITKRIVIEGGEGTAVIH